MTPSTVMGPCEREDAITTATMVKERSSSYEQYSAECSTTYVQYLDTTIKHFNKLRFWYTYENWKRIVDEVWGSDEED